MSARNPGVAWGKVASLRYIEQSARQFKRNSAVSSGLINLASDFTFMKTDRVLFLA